MRILIVNVNTTQTMTDAIAEVARGAASADTEIVALTPEFGPASVEGNFESLLSAVAVMDRVATFTEPYDAVILAGFGDHGREGLQELLTVPVVDITDAAAHLAGLLGHSFSVVTMHDRSVPLVVERLGQARLAGKCVSVRATGRGVLEIHNGDTASTRAAIVAESVRAVTDDRAEVICLGCAGMAGLREEVAAATGVPVVDGVEAAVVLAESLVRLRLSTSKVRTFATPERKAVWGWPITATAAERNDQGEAVASADA